MLFFCKSGGEGRPKNTHTHTHTQAQNRNNNLTNEQKYTKNTS